MLQSDGFNGKGGKGDYRWLLEDVLQFESRLVVTCTGTKNFVELEELVRRNGDDG